MSPTESLSPDIRKYLEALGHFVTLFSLVELTMQKTLWHFVGVSPPIAPAIFSGTRIDAASSHIKRIGEATHWPKERRDFFDAITLQLGEITQTRNDLLHYGAQPDETQKNFLISNALLAHTAERIRTTKISPEILDQMTSDILLIFLQLTLFVDNNPTPALPLLAASALKGAWKYKPERRRGQSKNAPPPPQE